MAEAPAPQIIVDTLRAVAGFQLAAALALAAFGCWLMVNPAAFIARTRKNPVKRWMYAWIDRTAYGRWYRRFEEPFTRVIGAVGALFAVFVTVRSLA